MMGEAGLLCDPFDVDALASAIARLIDDAELRAQLRVKGFEQARRFDWLETARQTLRVYERAAASSKQAR